eukprot:1140841-Pelagomonas_calceolata.AAC.4
MHASGGRNHPSVAAESILHRCGKRADRRRPVAQQGQRQVACGSRTPAHHGKQTGAFCGARRALFLRRNT